MPLKEFELVKEWNFYRQINIYLLIKNWINIFVNTWMDKFCGVKILFLIFFMILKKLLHVRVKHLFCGVNPVFVWYKRLDPKNKL